MIKVDISHLKRSNLNKKKSIGNNLLPIENNKVKTEHIDISFELVNNKKINDFLIDKSKELIGVQANARLHLGEIFEEVFQELSGSPHDGLYIKWINLNGFNKMTALRHRNRFKVFRLISNEKSKSLIATLPQRTIDSIINYPNQKVILSRLENNITKSELADLFTPIQLESNRDHKNLDLNLNSKYKDFKKKYDSLDISKLSKSQEKKLLKLLTNFEDLINNLT